MSYPEIQSTPVNLSSNLDLKETGKFIAVSAKTNQRRRINVDESTKTNLQRRVNEDDSTKTNWRRRISKDEFPKTNQQRRSNDGTKTPPIVHDDPWRNQYSDERKSWTMAGCEYRWVMDADHNDQRGDVNLIWTIYDFDTQNIANV